MVRHDRQLHGGRGHGRPHALAVHGQPHRGHRRAVLSGARCRPFFRHGESARHAAPAGRADHARGAADRGNAGRVHCAAVAVQPVLHADSGIVELAGVPQHRRPGAAVSDDPGVRHHRLDCRRSFYRLCARPVYRRRAARSHAFAAVYERCRQPAARRLQLHLAAHAAARRGAGGVATQYRRRGRFSATRQPFLLYLHRLLVFNLHSAGGLLQLRADIYRQRGLRPGNEQCARRCAAQSLVPDELRADVGDRLHAADAAVVHALRREVDAGDRHGGVDSALRPVRAWRARCGVLDGGCRHTAARYLLRLLFCHRADLCR